MADNIKPVTRSRSVDPGEVVYSDMVSGSI